MILRLFSIENIWGGMPSFIIDIILALVILATIGLISYKGRLRIRVFLIALAACLSLFVASIFNLFLLKEAIYVIMFFLTFCGSILLTKRERENFLRNKKHIKKNNNLTIDETEFLFKNLEKAVNDLSTSKTGALITIEKKDDMSEFIRNSGVQVNARVTPELLETIFFNKTPLHDGATIIRGNEIMTSAVFYQPTQKPLAGKYGSRHRAALGISEVSDSLTIVVSEETGKVSFAYKGELIPVPVVEFKTLLTEYYFENSKGTE